MIVFLAVLLLTSPCIGRPSLTGHSNKLAFKHYSKDYSNTGVCLQEAECIPLQNATCFGISLPYSSTSIDLAEDSNSLFEIQDNLALWQGLRSVPRCWAVVQPLLCAVYMPKCENGSVFLPSQEMCRITRAPCKSVEVKHGWPDFLKCENRQLYPSRCRNPLQEVKFNTSYKCIPPLVETDNRDNWFHEVQGCGIQCHNPFYTEEEHASTHKLISVLATICLIGNVYTIATFLISWKTARKYTGVIIFYLNVCLAAMSFGWLIQFLSTKEIACADDGTILKNQPRFDESLCTFTFILTYFSLMASLVWFVILMYAWHIQFKHPGTPEVVEKKRGYFHMFAWVIPLVLTTCVMSLSQVDGDSMSGICFIGYADVKWRIGFLLVPLGGAAIIGGFFLACGLYSLIKLRLKSEAAAPKKQLRRLILKLGVISTFAEIFIICTFACHAYDILNREEWDDSLREYLVCLAMNSANSIGELPRCKLKSKPSIGVIRIQLFCLFGYGIAVSLWTWTRESVEVWKRKIYGFCKPAEKKNRGVSRSKVIAGAYPHRHILNQGHLSLSLNSTHDDPIGMNLDAYSVASKDISTSWAAALPRFINRRNAVTGVMPFIPRHYSSASEMSRHISMDSFNQPTLDSLSMQISEQDYAHALRHQRRKTKKERERLYVRANRNVPWMTGIRRGSDTSLQSSLIAASFAAAAKKAGIVPKITKATSTGDLGVVLPGVIPPAAMFPPVMRPPVNNRRQRQNEPPINHPFTHGMTDNSHCLSSRVPSVASALPRVHSGQRYMPSQCSTAVPGSVVGMIPQPMFGGSYDVLNSAPYSYFGMGMYPPMNGLYPGYPVNPELLYNPYFQYSSLASCNGQYQQDILPMHPVPDSASETEYFPIRISDSEFTDTGMRSYDESQLMTHARLMYEHMQAQEAAAAAAESAAQNAASTQPKHELEPQACAKSVLKKFWPFGNKANQAVPEATRPPSGCKSPHSEAPPPSPVELSQSVNEDDDLDDVFDEPEEDKKGASALSLHSVASGTENVIQKMKSKFGRATSMMSNLEKTDEMEDEIELSKAFHSSLGQLSKSSSTAKKSPPSKNILKETLLHADEGVNLINEDAATENVSR